MVGDERVWSLPVRSDEIPEAGRQVDLSADAPTRAAVARTAGIPGIDRLQATFDVTRHGRDGLRVTGRVSATVRQTCVVTLEPIANEVEEPVDLIFLPAAPAGEGDIEAVLDAPEPPETLQNGAVDLARLAVEFLVLGLDPYPRKPGASFEAPAAADAAANPFAALAALKPRSGETGD